LIEHHFKVGGLKLCLCLDLMFVFGSLWRIYIDSYESCSIKIGHILQDTILINLPIVNYRIKIVCFELESDLCFKFKFIQVNSKRTIEEDRPYIVQKGGDRILTLVGLHRWPV